MPRKSFMVTLSLKASIENSKRVIESTHKYLSERWWTEKAAYMQHSVSFIVVCHLPDTVLMERLKPLIERLGGVERFWIHDAPKHVVSSDPAFFDPFRTALVNAGEELRHPSHLKNVRQAKGFGGVFRAVENRQGGAIGQMPREGSGMGQPAKYPDRK